MPIERFAEVEDLETRWRTLDADERARADALIGDASAMLSGMLARAGIDPGDDDVIARNLKAVTCSMVTRAMMSSDNDAFGVTQTSQTAGAYSQSFTFANPGGDMYVTRAERKLLGVDRQRGRFYTPYGAKAGDGE